MVYVVIALAVTDVALLIVVVVLSRALYLAQAKNFDLQVFNRKLRSERSR